MWVPLPFPFSPPSSLVSPPHSPPSPPLPLPHQTPLSPFLALRRRQFPSASFVVLCQLAFSAALARGLGACGFIDCEPLHWGKVKPFLLVPILFTLCLWTNVKALGLSSVETVIVVRASTPIFVALLDALWLKSGWPSPQTWLSLLGILVGAVFYALTDKGIETDTVIWLVIYLVAICIEMCYVKHVMNTVEMTTWTRVYYNNVLGLPPALIFGLVRVKV